MSKTLELLIAARQGKTEARKRLLEDNIGLVWSVARRFQNRGQELEDLFQIGCIGLIKAIDNFDTDRPVQLSTYAVPMIMGEIKRFLRDDGMVKVSRTLKEQGYRIKLASDAIRSECGREATIEEIAVATELSQEEIMMALDANAMVDSIDRTISNREGDVGFVGECIRSPEDGHGQVENEMLVQQLMNGLNELERSVIQMRFYEDKTQVEIGELLDISQVQVSRLEKRAIKKMRGFGEI